MAKKKTEEVNDTTAKFEDNQPILSRNLFLSKDRNWLIIKTIRTDIVHVNYLNKVLEGDNVPGK